MRPRTPTQSPASEKQAKKRAYKRRKRIIRISIIAAIAVGLMILLFRLPLFRVRTIETEGNQLVQTDALIEVTWEQLLGNHLLIIPNNNIFFLRANKLRNVLMQRFPRIEELEIERGNLQTLQLIIHERPHAFVWCVDESMSQCYFADDNGLLFARAPYFSSSVFLTFFGGDISDSTYIDAHIINDKVEFKRLVAIVHAFEDNNFSVTSVTINKRVGDYTLSVSHIKDVRTPNAEIIVTTKTKPETIMYNLGLAMNTEEFKEAFASRAETLDYIDARLLEKVFYKFGTSSKPVPTPVVQ